MRCSAIRRARDVFSAATEMATVMKSRPTDLRKFFSDLVDFAIYVMRFTGATITFVMVVVRDDRNKFASMFTGIATVIGLHKELTRCNVSEFRHSSGCALTSVLQANPLL